MGVNNENDGTKPYMIKRRNGYNGNVIPYIDNLSGYSEDISVFVLYHEKNKRYVENMQRSLENKKVTLIKGLADTEIAYEDKIDIVNNFNYMVVVVSKPLLEDLDLLDVLAENFELEGKNKKIIPMIVWKDLYEPEIKSEVIEALQERIENYRQHHFDDDFSGHVAVELKRMQRILKMLKCFLIFATDRDRKSTMSGTEKLLKYIRYDRGVEVAEKETVGESKKPVLNQTIYNVHDGGQVNMASNNATINVTANNKK